MANNVPDGYHMFEIHDTLYIVPLRYSNLQSWGYGAQGTVVAAHDSESNKRVAIKKLRRPFQNVTYAKRAFREIVLMRLLRHKNIIPLLDVFSPQQTLESFQDVYLVMELMDANLSQLLFVDLDHERISFLLYQMLCGVRHLHLGGIIHRDLKPSNLGVGQDCVLKILDFGLARISSNDDALTPYVVTRYYRAPEVILGLDYAEKVDVWALGCIFAELILARTMFPGRNHVDQWFTITETLGTPDMSFLNRLEPGVRRFVMNRPRCPPMSFETLFPDERFPPPSQHEALNAEQARDLLKRMLVIDPVSRISVEEALQHPYVNLWYDESEVNGVPPCQYDVNLYERDLSVEEYRRYIFEEVQQFRAVHDMQ